jgi:hypothetical protein
MITKEAKSRAIDLCDLDVEELEERLELAALFATKPGSINGEQAVAMDWGGCSPSGPVIC